MQVRIKRIRDDVVIPQYQTKGAAGFDLAAAEDTVVKDFALVPTGLVIQAPPGHMLMVAPRSSLFKRHGLIMPHSVGIVDEDYSGDEDEISIPLYRIGDYWPDAEDFGLIKAGERIAQGLIVPVPRAEFVEAIHMGESRGGFGSTGVK